MELLVYKASAGSGKTFTLAVEYIKHLIINPRAYRQILAVTFTNKATAEMKERILTQLYGIWKGAPSSEAYLERIKNYKLKIKGGEEAGIWEKGVMLRFFQVNRDIFLRTLCLVAVTLFFTSAGASQGEIILAVNTLLMQLFTLFSYVMDGFAYAGEALSGRYIGARNREAFTDTVRHLFGWGAVMAVLFTLVYALGGNAFLGLLTDDKEVIAVADTYFYWALAVPAVGIAAFIWDGIFIGATATRGMLLSMAAAAVSFFILYYGLHPVLANHALWLAFLTYLLMRGVVQTGLSREVIRRAFPSKKEPAWR